MWRSEILICFGAGVGARKLFRQRFLLPDTYVECTQCKLEKQSRSPLSIVMFLLTGVSCSFDKGVLKAHAHPHR